MVKKCPHCGFENNPNDAHYCGLCGKNIADFGCEWKLYNRSRYTPILNFKLKEYQEYERRAKSTIWNKMTDQWKRFTNWWEEDGSAIAGLIFAVAVFIGFIIWAFQSCEEVKKSISHIKVNGKYGIKYAADNLLVSAKYDSISLSEYYNQWILYDKKNNTCGIVPQSELPHRKMVKF